MFEEASLEGGVLTKAVSDLISDREKLRKMSEAISMTAVSNAAELIYNDLKANILK